MLNRNVLIDGLVYSQHEVMAIVHHIGDLTSVVVASHGEERTVERDFSRDYSDGMTEAQAEAWVFALDAFEEYFDPKDDLIDDIAGLLTDEQAAQFPSAYHMWELDTGYSVGDRVRYGTGLYKCLQDHTSQEGWEPVNAPSIWATIIASEDPDEPLPWVQPDSTNAYMIGDVVTHDGKTWRSLVDNNVWEPGTAGSENLWEEVVGGSEPDTPAEPSEPETPAEPTEPEGYPEWSQPDSSNPYMTGDRVVHNGTVYESTADNNVWEPGVYGWEEVTE